MDPGSAATGGEWGRALGEFAGGPYPGFWRNSSCTAFRKHRQGLLEGEESTLLASLFLQMGQLRPRGAMELAPSHTALSAFPAGENNSLQCPREGSL